MDERLTLQIEFGLTPYLADLLLLLVNNRIVTQQMVEVEHQISNHYRVAFQRLRQRMAPRGYNILSIQRTGYYLTSADRRKLLGVMRVADADSREIDAHLAEDADGDADEVVEDTLEGDTDE